MVARETQIESRQSERQVHSNMGASSFPELLKFWRGLRKLSQLELAFDADVSQRHVSFLESGRAKPSREMILQLSKALDLPLRERNQLLSAAGFAALYQERDLNDADMSAVRRALEMSLKHHEPYPALVVDRNWNLLMRNQAAEALVRFIGEPEKVWQTVDPSGKKNVYRMTFHDQGFKQFIANWEFLSRILMMRLQKEVVADPGNERLHDLYRELLAQSPELEASLASNSKLSDSNSLSAAPVLSMELSVGSMKLNLFSMVSAFGTAQDVTAQEIKVETFYPADDFTEQFFARLGVSQKN